ncbi:MAG: glycine--tRNA ligase subunit beta [Terriglobia bacterium]
MSGEFLLEIGCEEIPAWMLPGASSSLQELLEGEFRRHALLERGRVETFATPRRLVAHCARLAAREPERFTQVVGPPSSVAYDAAGRPTRAAESFAHKQGIHVNQLKIVDTHKGTYVAAIKHQSGRPTRALLAEILPTLIPRISFPRTMYWTSPRGLRFIRPIRWLLTLYAGQGVEFELGGVRSGRLTYGHRLLRNRRIPVRSFAEYRRRLRKAYVLVDAAERRERILRQSKRLLRALGLRMREDHELLGLLVNLVEHPAVVRGQFSSSFLSLPTEVVVTVMRHHQKYLSVEDRRGNLVPYFLAVTDLDTDHGGDVRRGHQAVLAARFRDAQFFWEADQRRSLAERLPLLEQVTFQSALGDYAKKVGRLARVGRWLGENAWADGRRADIEGVVRAAMLSKADLTTEMVGEFPELQGVVGGLYARAQGEPPTVARAIGDHYRPAGPDDATPGTLEGAVLGLADKLDTIVGCFSVGLAPSGSRDPFALRRAASGVVRIILEHKLRVSLGAAIQEALRVLRESGIAIATTTALEQSIGSFLEERARHLFREVRRFAYDEVNAAFAAGWDDLVDAAARLEALRRLRASPDFEPIAAAFKRIRNILAQAGDGERRAARPISTDLIRSGAERDLYHRFLELRPVVGELRAAHRYEEALRRIASLRPQVDRYFDTVLVMEKDEAVRENRLAFLAHLLREFSTIADFSEVVVSSKEKKE